MQHIYRKLARRIFIEFDGLTLRILLAIASLGWFAALVANPDRFSREAFSIMAEIGGAYCWAGLFLLHFCAVAWKVTRPTSQPVVALAVNGYGFAIWLFSTVSINVAVGYFAPTTALAWVAVSAAAYDLGRTGLRPERVAV